MRTALFRLDLAACLNYVQRVDRRAAHRGASPLTDPTPTYKPIFNDSTPIVLAPTNAYAVISIVGGIFSFTLVGALVAVVFGHLSLKQIGGGSRERGRALAIVGLVLGYLSIAGAVVGGAIATILLVILAGTFGA
jgi:hypothetical protein